jgi:hypothetical protein
MPFTIDIPEPRAAGSEAAIEDRGGLAELSEFYRQLGFEAGYAQAARDQLELSVVTAEQILGEQILREQNTLTRPNDRRRLLYAFIARLNRKLSLFSDSTRAQDTAISNEGLDDQNREGCGDHYVEGGMGI